MENCADMFDHCLHLPPEGDVEALAAQAPARWVVYLMADEAGRPVQLLCVKDLRYSLRRRLGKARDEGPSRRIDYRQVVRRIYWRRVDSAFEADAVFLEASRELFPRTYRAMLSRRAAWFVHVDPEARFPRYTRTSDLAGRGGWLIGPLEDKHAAQRLIELAEDTFDLCRYHNILVEAPHAKACAYKQMHKCPAPCDGSIGMEQYRRMVLWSAQTLVDPRPMIQEQQRRMRQAAGELRFESAARIKAHIDQLGQLGRGALRHVRRIEDFRFLSVQRGPRQNTAKLFLITPGRIEQVLGLLTEPADQVADALATPEASSGTLDQAGAERIGVVAHHLFSPQRDSGVFLPVGEVTAGSLAKAFGDVQKQKPSEPAETAEGVVSELDSG